MTGTSVVDYKYVDLVKIAEKGCQDEEESGVCNLRLLVHDDRMEYALDVGPRFDPQTNILHVNRRLMGCPAWHDSVVPVTHFSL